MGNKRSVTVAPGEGAKQVLESQVLGGARTSQWKLKRRLWTTLRFLVLGLVGASILVPIYYLIATSLKLKAQFLANPWGLPVNPTLANFLQMFGQGKVLRWFVNSAILTTSSVLLVLAVSSLASFALARMDFAGKHLITSSTIALMSIPSVVMLVPLAGLAWRANLLDTYAAPILVYVGILLPFSIYLLTSFFLTIPQEIIDSAIIDGCGDLQTLASIVLPLSKPALLTLAVVDGFSVWNDLLFALVLLQSPEMYTLTVGIAFFRERYYVNEPLMMAGLLIASLPMVIAYVLSQQYFTRGLVAGALKG